MPASHHLPDGPPSRRLGAALVLYLGLIIVIVTLVPFRPAWPAGFRVVGFTGAFDVVANIVLFLPLGFFVAFAGPGPGRPALVALALSLSVELCQQALPQRSPSLLDVGANTAGGALGGVAYWLVARAWAARAPRRVLALDLPLLGGVYLAIPLLWLSGLGAGGDPGREWLAMVLAASGVPIFAAVARHHLTFVSKARTAIAAALMTGAWTTIGLVPGWLLSPRFLLAAVGTLATSAAVLSLFPMAVSSDHRYELPTLRRAGLVLAAYLTLAALWPLDRLQSVWRADWLMAAGPHADATITILRLLELVAGATLAGYLLAESRSRAGADDGQSVGWLARAGVTLAAVLVGLRGFHQDHQTTLVEIGLVAFAAGFGGVLYRLQLEFVRSVVNDVRSMSPSRLRYPPVRQSRRPRTLAS